MSAIVLTGLSANDPVPGNYVEINFAQGAASLGTTTYPVLFLGNKTSSGSATVDTVIYGPNSSPSLASEQDAITLFGTGSELHRMIRAFLKVNKVTPFYAVAVTASAGAAATRDHVVSGTITADGFLRIYVGDEFVDTAIASGDTAATVATNAVAAVNTRTHWPVTASVVTSTTIRLSARQAGLRGNWLRSGAQLFGATGGAVTNGSQGYFTSGTTADSNTAALSTILPFRYYYIVSAAEDATQLGALVSQVNTQASPTTGIRQRVIGASIDTLSNATTIATGRNAARAEIAWLAQSDWEPPVLAANHAAVVSLFESSFPFRTNFAGFGNDAVTSQYWYVPAPRSGSAPTRANIASALNNGLCPIGVNANGSTYLVDRITTRSLNGSVNDYRIRDAHKVTICDRYADDLVSKLSQQFSGKKIANDPPRGGRQPGPDVATPRSIKAAVDQLTREYGNVDLLQNVDDIIAATIVVRETSPSTRASIRVPLQPVDNLKQTATAVDQVS